MFISARSIPSPFRLFTGQSTGHQRAGLRCTRQRADDRGRSYCGGHVGAVRADRVPVQEVQNLLQAQSVQKQSE